MFNRDPSTGRHGTVKLAAAGGTVLVIAASAVLFAGAASSVADQPQITAAVEGTIHEYLAGAAVDPAVVADGRFSDAERAVVVSSGKERLARVATGAALEMLSKNIDQVADLEQSGDRGVITEYRSDTVLVDVLHGDGARVVAQGREHGTATFHDPAAGSFNQAAQWSYFDTTLERVDGAWLVSSFRLIPTLSDDEKGVDPYPAKGDPADAVGAG